MDSIVTINQAPHFPEKRSNPYAGWADILPLPAEPYGWGLPFPGTETTSTLADISPGDFAELEQVILEVDGVEQTIKVDPFYPFHEIEDGYARGMTKLKSCLCGPIYFPIVNVSPNGVTAENYDLEIKLPEGITVVSADFAGSTVTAT